MVLNPNPSKILIQRADRMGDLLMSLAVIDVLKKKFPKSELHIIVSKAGYPVVKSHPNLHKCWLIDSTSFFSMLRLCHELKKENFSIYINLWNHQTLKLIGLFCNIPIRIGYKLSLLDFIIFNYSQKATFKNLSKHLIEFNLDLLKALHIHAPISNGTLSVPSVYSEKTKDILKNYPINHKKIIVIVTETGGSNIPFPYDVLSAFIEHLASTDNYVILLSGNSPHNPFYTYQSSKNIINLIGNSSFDDLVKYINDCDYYIGPCTGPTHIASILQKPSLIFSSLKKNPPSIFGSLSPKQIIIREDMQLAKLHIKEEDMNTYLSFLSLDYLLKQFDHLIKSSEKTIEQIRYYHLKKHCEYCIFHTHMNKNHC
jgi:ADP-heptose:LPS heptosyltransferase